MGIDEGNVLSEEKPYWDVFASIIQHILCTNVNANDNCDTPEIVYFFCRLIAHSLSLDALSDTFILSFLRLHSALVSNYANNHPLIQMLNNADHSSTVEQLFECLLQRCEFIPPQLLKNTNLLWWLLVPIAQLASTGDSDNGRNLLKQLFQDEPKLARHINANILGDSHLMTKQIAGKLEHTSPLYWLSYADKQHELLLMILQHNPLLAEHINATMLAAGPSTDTHKNTSALYWLSSVETAHISHHSVKDF